MADDKVLLKIIQTDGQMPEYEVARGINLLDAFREIGISMPSPCGGIGKCGKCKVKLKGDLPGEHSPEEINLLTDAELRDGYRLACKTFAGDNMTIAAQSLFNTQRRSIQGLASNGIFPEPRDVSNDTGEHFGLAVDIGTTTIVVYLVNLDTGVVPAVETEANSQVVYGADVISRINYANNKSGLEELKAVITSQLNSMIISMLEKHGLDKKLVRKVIFSGNTTMLNILLGLSVESLGVYPYTPSAVDMMVKTPEETGIDVNVEAEVIILPSVSSFIGADIVSGIAAVEMHKFDTYCMLIDLGTNGEMVLGRKDFMIACSAAMGPAFEGAGIEYGMAGTTGAVERVVINNNGVFYSAIGNAKPIGICGSGIIDAAACLLKMGIIDSSGKMLSEEALRSKPDLKKLAQRIETYKNKPAFRIAGDGKDDRILFTQDDVRQIQLAKAAISLGIGALIRKTEITAQKIDKVYLAGGFGGYIDVDNAVTIGLFPEELKDKIVSAGNTSGEGAVRCLISPDAVNECVDIQQKVDYFDLSRIDNFQDLFIDNLGFK